MISGAVSGRRQMIAAATTVIMLQDNNTLQKNVVLQKLC